LPFHIHIILKVNRQKDWSGLIIYEHADVLAFPVINSSLLHLSLGCDPKSDDSHDSALFPRIDSVMINNKSLAIKGLNRMTN